MQPQQSTRAVSDTDTFRVRQDGQLVHVAASDVLAYAQAGVAKMNGQLSTAASTTITSASPYRTRVNNASASTVVLTTNAADDETHVIVNVGAGTVTVNYPGRTGPSTKAIAQDNALTFAYSKALGYWTIE
ncbi:MULTISPECIES: hypothetical protein [unclassified Caballeronia]|uniref:hypothetical protein n=1 Tax=unclassified Caballeronia TaxID=2646786 RepID=UPI00285C2702|nr:MULTISPECIES: hypothetical protein [unclassified Caballeronia]MDR5772088.1 hypothetical protein [Caballeronia sp. LZ002]MDR5847522.1 hypothetical protein [Caballeronia sp. LZ003]